MSQINMIAGRFEQLEAIGEGAMGTVFKGRDNQTGDLVAIKALKSDVIKNDPQIIERFDREGEALRRLNHPSIVKVIATAIEDGRHYLVLEYVEGGSLRDLLTEQGQLSIAQVLEIALDLSDALARAHRLDIVHRDLKPANVLIATDGTPRLTDFGIARIGDTSRMTQTGAIMGTLAYLSPEALSGQTTDYRGDIWAFGVMLYEMCTGRRPFDGDNTGAILNGILNTEPPDMLQFREYEAFGSWGLPGLIYWMLEKEREKRPQSARLIGAMVENLMSGKELPSYNWFGDTTGAYDDPTRLPAPSDAAKAVREFTTSGFTLSEINAELAAADVAQIPPSSSVTTEDDDWVADPTISRQDWSIKLKHKIDHPPRIFISYRRIDSTAMTGRIHDRLTMAFGAENIFKDVMNIPAGADYLDVIKRQIRASDVVLVVIGDKWTNAANEDGRRLEQADDVVRFEVEMALETPQTLVIPVLVNNARMPEERLLPPRMRPLLNHNAAPVRHDPDFNRDIEWLINQIFNAFEVEQTGRQISWMSIAAAAGFVLAIILSVSLLWLLLNQSDRNAVIETMPENCNVEPVADDEFMILVAQLENISGEERDVQRFIVDDLREHVEVAVPNSRYRVRQSPTIITEPEQAPQLAALCGALVVIWGDYDDDLIEVRVELGDLASYPNPSSFDEADIRVFTDARYRMSDERRETLAVGIFATLAGVWTATNDSYRVGEAIMITDIVIDPSAEIVGSTTAARYHAFLGDYIDDPEQAVSFLDQAIITNGANPMLYIARSLGHLRLGQNDDASEDIQAAAALSPENWMQPDFMMANYLIYTENDIEGAIPYIDRALEIVPDDWFLNSLRAATSYMLFDYDDAEIYADRSLVNDPQASFPYATATGLALRDADFIRAQELYNAVQQQFPTPEFAELIASLTFNEEATRAPIISFFVGFGNFALQRWNNVIEVTDAALEIGIEHPDIYLLRGYAQCNLEQYEAAVEAYEQALALQPDYYAIHLLLAEALVRQGMPQALQAPQQLVALQQSPQAEQFEAFTSMNMLDLLDQVSCKNFFDLDFTEFGFESGVTSE